MMSGRVIINEPTIIRRPLLKCPDFKEKSQDLTDFDSLAANKRLMLAIRYQSAGLFKKIKKAAGSKNAKSKKNLLPVLQKYFLRSYSHPIPRGLFAGYEFPHSAKNKYTSKEFSNVILKKNMADAFIINSTLIFLDQNTVQVKINTTHSWKTNRLVLEKELYKNLKIIFKEFSKSTLVKKEIIAKLGLEKSKLSEQIYDYLISVGIFLKIDLPYFLPHYSGFFRKENNNGQYLKQSMVELEIQNSPTISNSRISSAVTSDLKVVTEFLVKLYLNNPKRMSVERAAADFIEEMNGAVDFHVFSEWWKNKMGSEKMIYFEKKMEVQVNVLKQILSSFIAGSNIHMSIDDFKKLAESLPYPPVSSDPIIGSLFLEKISENEVFMECMLGGSSTKILSRHAPYSETARKEVKKILENEEKLFNKDYYQIIYGELNATLQAINTPLLNHKKNILFNAPSFGSSDISINDILVHSNGRTFVLFDKNTGQEIKPFISHLWVWNQSTNLYFKTLCEVAVQNEVGFESFGNYLFGFQSDWPQIKLGSCIICPRRWYFNLKNFRGSILEALKSKGVPSLFFLMTNERRLLFNMADRGLKNLFIEMVKNLEEFQLEECFTTLDQSKFLLRTIYPFTCLIPSSTKDVLSNFQLQSKKTEAVKKCFYFKIYMSAEDMDFFIKKKLIGKPLDLLNSKNLIWFFVRYFDDGPHLRVRIFYSDSAADLKIKKKILCFYDELQKMQAECGISHFMTKPYTPEYVRYGGVEGVSLMETHAHKQSELIGQLLKNNLFSPTAEQKSAMLLALMQSYLDIFFDDQKSKIQFLERRLYSDKSKVRASIDKKEKENACKLMEKSNSNFLNICKSFEKQIDSLKKELNSLKRRKKLTCSIESFLINTMHLLVNRFDLHLVREEAKLVSTLLHYNHSRKPMFIVDSKRAIYDHIK